MSKTDTDHTQSEVQTEHGKAPIRWRGVLFAAAITLLLVTATDGLAHQLELGAGRQLLPLIVAPVIAGILTAFYTGQRGGYSCLVGQSFEHPYPAVQHLSRHLAIRPLCLRFLYDWGRGHRDFDA